MSIRKQIFSAMAILMGVFLITIFFMSRNARDLQYLTKLATNSNGLSTSFFSLETQSLRFRSEKHTISNSMYSFNATKNEFSKLLDELNSTLDNDLIDEEQRARWENINKLWSHIEIQIDLVIEKLGGMERKTISTLFTSYSFSTILSDINLVLGNDRYKDEYLNIRAIDTALQTLGSTTEILNKALLDTRILLEESVAIRSKTNERISMIALIVAALFGILFTIIFSNSISRKIITVKNILQEISNKNLSVDVNIKSKDEFGELAQYVKELVVNLKVFIESAGQSALKVQETREVLDRETHVSEDSLNGINNTVNEVKSRVSELDRNIEKSSIDITSMDSEISGIVNFINDQTLAVSTSSSAIEEMTASVAQIANLTSAKQSTTDSLLQVVTQGGESVDNTYENILKVSSEIVQIRDLVDVIKNVADQTNILSMNAAIESAHAGDAGKGFSVVADEIRALAEYTSNNVTAINKAIKSISLRIEASLRASEESATVFDKINKDVNEFSQAMLNISSSIEELASGGQEILNSTSTLSDINYSVKDSAHKIKKQSEIINRAMATIKSVSSDVNSHIIGISNRTDMVIESFKGINSVSDQSNEQIKDLTGRIDEFKLD
ncbi:MAG: HAMP domain-containing protein [Spirochaetales bacterium]|nr:HAMP domain-containing protein [Spirochaetales bacterium]